jgi:hypothetical protein
MRKISIVGAAILAVFAFSAIAAASAFAEPELLVNAKTFAGSVPVVTTGTLLLEDSGAGTAVECKGSFVGETESKLGLLTLVEAEGVNFTETVNVGKFATCKFEKVGLCDATPAPEVKPINLPWHIELLLEEPTTGTNLYILMILEWETKGEPGWEVMCTAPIVGLTTDTCKGETGADLTNVTGPPEELLGAFLENEELATPSVTCSVGGAKTGLVVSVATPITSTSGALNVSG